MFRAVWILLCFAPAVLHADPGNPAIDAGQHLRVVNQALQAREGRRLSEAGFLRLSRLPGAVILDARSAERFGEMHVSGARHLAFPDFTEEALAAVLPDKNAPVLIYCNNNFVNQPRAFPTKRIEMALNLSTYAALHAYGYRNVYELGPLLDPARSLLPMSGSLTQADAPSTQAAAATAPFPDRR